MSSDDEVKVDIGPDADDMSAFLQNKNTVEASIVKLNDDTRKLEELQERSACAVDGAEEAVVSKELKRVIKSVNKSTRESQAILKTMAEANKKMKKERKRAQKKAKSEGKEFDDPTGHVLRIREQTLNSLTRKMVEAVRHHQMVKFESAERAKEKCLRRAKLVWPDKSEEELAREVTDNPTGMFQQGVQTQANAKMKRAYNEAADRAKDVERLQRSIQELYQMFQDLATLVSRQGEVLNSIETNVNTASKNVKKGNAQLVKAHKYQKKTRKCMCCLLIIGISIIMVFAVSTGVIVGA